MLKIYNGHAAIHGELYGQINRFIGDKAAIQIQEIIKNVNLSTHNTFVTVIMAILLLIVASGLFSEIQDSINYIWGIKSKPKRGLIRFVMNRLMAFFMIGAAGLLLLAGLVANSLMDLLNKHLLIFLLPQTFHLYYFLNLILLFLLTTILVVIIFKTLPDGKIVFKDCMLGASFTAVLFTAGKFLIGTYLSSSTINSVYGAAGSVILILAWIYYSAIILYFGAEFTKVYSRTYGKKITPNEYTVLHINR